LGSFEVEVVFLQGFGAGSSEVESKSMRMEGLVSVVFMVFCFGLYETRGGDEESGETVCRTGEGEAIGLGWKVVLAKRKDSFSEKLGELDGSIENA
jgi:hypothetical protein